MFEKCSEKVRTKFAKSSFRNLKVCSLCCSKSSASRSIPKLVCFSITEFYLESLVLLSLASFFRKILISFLFIIHDMSFIYTNRTDKIVTSDRSRFPIGSSQTSNHCRNICSIHMVIWTT